MIYRSVFVVIAVVHTAAARPAPWKTEAFVIDPLGGLMDASKSPS
jgi:hypothetical protein